MKAKKLLSVILALCMTLSVVQMTSITAFAGGGEGEVAAVYNTNGQIVYSNTTVQSCIDYASAGYTVKLISNACENITINSDDDLTLDLNGYVLKGDGTNHVVTNYGNLTIKDSNPTSVHHFSDSSTYTGLWVWDETETATDHIVNGGVITGGVYTSGSGIYNCNATLTMNGGNIVGNLAKVNMRITYGGGVYNKAQNDDGIDAVFTMNSGNIMGNATMCNSTMAGSGSYGAGVCNNGQYSTGSCAIFTMTGGSISNNTANKKNSTFCCGGGIENTEFYNFTMTGGTVSDNKAKTSGGGVRVQNTTGGTATIGGSAVISGNTLFDGTTVSNLYFNNTTINISTETPFVNGANVGVTLPTGTGQFTSNGTKADEAFFFSDNASYTDKYNDAGTSGDTTDDYLELIVPSKELENVNYSASLSIASDVSINLYMKNFEDGFESDKLGITVDGKEVSAKYDASKGVVSATLATVSPAEMDKEFAISVSYNGNEEKSFDFSVRDYCDRVFALDEDDQALATPTGKFTNLASLCKSLLNYGKYTIDYVNGGSSTLNSGHEIDFSKVTVSASEVVKNPGDIIAPVFAQLEINDDSTITMNYYVTSSKALTAKNVTIKNADDENVVSSDITVSKNPDMENGYIISLKNVGVSRFGRTYTLTSSIDEDFEYSYSVYNYCDDVQDQTGEEFTETLKKLCKSIYSFGEAAKTYVESKK